MDRLFCSQTNIRHDVIKVNYYTIVNIYKILKLDCPDCGFQEFEELCDPSDIFLLARWPSQDVFLLPLIP